MRKSIATTIAALALALSACGPTSNSSHSSAPGATHGSEVSPSTQTQPSDATTGMPSPTFTPSPALLSTANPSRLNWFGPQYDGSWEPTCSYHPPVIQPWNEQDCDFRGGQNEIRVTTLIDNPDKGLFRALGRQYKLAGTYHAAQADLNGSPGPDAFFDGDPSQPGAALFMHYGQIIVELKPLQDSTFFENTVYPNESMAETAGKILLDIQTHYGE